MSFVLINKQYTFSTHIKILLGIKAVKLSRNPILFYPRPFLITQFFLMAAATSETTSTIIAKPAAPKLGNFYFHSHSFQITTIRLNGSNFLRWSQAVRLYIRGRGKIGYLTGKTTEPEKTDATYATWDAENSMIMAWMVNAMEEDISANYMCYSSAKELWDNINQMYSDFGYQCQAYELETKLREIQPGENTVTKYFNTLKGLWQDLDLFMDYEWKCSEDVKPYIKMVECSRIFKFLAGRNLDFDEVRGRIIGRQPLPPMEKFFLKFVGKKAGEV